MDDRNTQPDHEQGLENGLTRRQFMKTAGLAVGAALTEGTLLASTPKPALSGAEGITAPAVLKGTKLHLLRYPTYNPTAEEEMRRQAEAWGKQTGVQVIIENIGINEDRLVRIATALSSGTRPDIVEMQHNWPHLYADDYVDTDDVAEKVEQTYRGYYKQIRDSCVVQGHYKAVPYHIIGWTMTYREDWFKEVGAEKFPESWDEFRKLGKILKDKGRPFGQALSHDYGDPPIFVYPYLQGEAPKKAIEWGVNELRKIYKS